MNDERPLTFSEKKYNIPVDSVTKFKFQIVNV